MVKAYFETLPKNYFGDLYKKVTENLTKGENICISVVPGFGTKTVFNFLEYYIKTDKLFDQILIYDPEIEKVNIVNFTSTALTRHPNKNKLIIVRFFETIDNKCKILEKLDRLRRRSPKSLVFLIFTDHTAIVNPSDYQANTTVFFTDVLYMKPFNLIQTENMINTLVNFYGWKIENITYLKIYELSGGIPRLIKYICKEIFENRTPLGNFEKFEITPQINFQLTLLTKMLITIKKYDLITLGLIDTNTKIRSKLLKHFFINYQNQIDKQIFSNLTKQESKLLTYLMENRDEIITIDKIADLIQMSEDDFSLWAIYKLISRLKPKVHNNFKIKNIKGLGYKLQKADL